MGKKPHNLSPFFYCRSIQLNTEWCQKTYDFSAQDPPLRANGVWPRLIIGSKQWFSQFSIAPPNNNQGEKLSILRDAQLSICVKKVAMRKPGQLRNLWVQKSLLNSLSFLVARMVFTVASMVFTVASSLKNSIVSSTLASIMLLNSIIRTPLRVFKRFPRPAQKNKRNANEPKKQRYGDMGKGKPRNH